MKILYRGAAAEITDRKSRFIAELRPVHTQEEAIRWFDEVGKRYWDARHHCTAYVLGYEQPLMRCSDDGEPAGTAGRPMLDVLMQEDIRDAAAVVTRYFGGVLLGTGGLVRAYRKAVQEALAGSIVPEVQTGYRVLLRVAYNDWGRVEYILRQADVLLEDTAYASDVSLSCVIPQEESKAVKALLADASNGRIQEQWGGLMRYAVCEGKIIILPADSVHG